MIKLNRMTRKRWAAMLLAAAFMIASAPAAYADGPSGPASDTAIAENSREEAKGPGAGPEQQPVQPEQPAEGMIASGGRYIDPTKPMVALTFDDGPYAPVGNRIMDSLEQHNGRATFFVVGSRVPSYQAEIKRMHNNCLLYTSPSPRDGLLSRMPSSA